MKVGTVHVTIEVESGVVDPVKLQHVIESIEHTDRSETDRWNVTRTELEAPA